MWTNFRIQLPAINDIKLDRCVIPPSSNRIQLHGFADASKIAYGACLYVRTIDNNNKVTVHLLCSRSRIAPLKSVTIPRLELMAAVLLSRLVVKIKSGMEIEFEKVVLWSDSSITLSWIKLPPSNLTSFVAHRTTEIQESTAEMEWRHISGKMNPADILSRGSMPNDLQSSQLWWQGPAFLQSNEEAWPKQAIKLNNEELPEIQQSTIVFMTNIPVDIFNICRYSNFLKLQRITAYCLRFINNSRSKDKKNRLTGGLNAAEMKRSTTALVKLVQQQEFHKELVTWKNSSSGKKTNFSNLSPFVDSEGLVRVGGRIDHSSLSYDAKHPYLLPKHHLTEIIVRHVHEQNLHCSVQTTLSTVRQTFWPIQGTNTVKRILRQCITCYRLQPRMLHQVMGNLPTPRMTADRPFSTTGIDYCGPFLVRHKFQRKAVTSKMYVCIFICFAVKAVHLEIAEDATAASFIACLKRFLGRRGKVNTIWSDNGTNFVGANAELKRLFQQFHKEADNDIKALCTNEGIDWTFIPPRSPHIGGLWESTVKVFKSHLKKTLGQQEYKFEQLNTIVVQIEGIMNSRPLTPLSSDDNDVEPLTPGHFLTGGPMNCILEPTVNVPDNRMKYWQLITQKTQMFWQRFSKDYLHTLQQKKKWFCNQPNLQVNDIVIVHDDNLPPAKWMLGRITKTTTGADDKVRIAHIKTKAGIIQRAITKLAKLPIEKH